MTTVYCDNSNITYCNPILLERTEPISPSAPTQGIYAYKDKYLDRWKILLVLDYQEKTEVIPMLSDYNSLDSLMNALYWRGL